MLLRGSFTYVRSFSVVPHDLAVVAHLSHAGPRLPIATEQGTVILAIGALVLLVIGYDVYRRARGGG